MTIEPELVARMIALTNMVAGPSSIAPTWRAEAEARAILGLLPKPVDPDLAEARRLADRICVSGDDEDLERAALAGLKRGRELAAKDMAK